MRSEPTLIKLPVRIALVAFFAVLIQETVVSQISVFGITADITSLVVMSIGLLCGAMPGAITGFWVGLFVDLALFQTVGVTSLLYIVIGYWSGRFREQFDPSHGLIPLAMGAASTLVAQVGMGVIQFMLGVNAPVSWLLAEQIVLQVLINSLIALPVYAIVRRLLRRSMDDGRRRPRAYTTGYSGSSMSPLQSHTQRSRRAPARFGR
jgi:rod shape-determining protein MreD